MFQIFQTRREFLEIHRLVQAAEQNDDVVIASGRGERDILDRKMHNVVRGFLEDSLDGAPLSVTKGGRGALAFACCDNAYSGGTTLDEMERPLFFVGPGVKRGYEIPWVTLCPDVGATIAHVLDIRPARVWTGRVIDDIFDLAK